MAGLHAREEEEEGPAGAGCAGLPPAAPPGGHNPASVLHIQHEGLPAAAAGAAAGPGRPRSPSCEERAGQGKTSADKLYCRQPRVFTV